MSKFKNQTSLYFKINLHTYKDNAPILPDLKKADIFSAETS